MVNKNKRAEKRVEEVIDLKDIFGTEKGLKSLYALCKRFHYFSPSYQGNVNDCLFNEGERNVINFIMCQLQQNPARLMDDFRRQLKEEVNYED